MVIRHKKWLAFLGLFVVLFAFLAAQSYAGPRLDRIMETKILRVGTPGDYRPFAMKTESGYVGHDIDVIEMIAKELGVEIVYVPTSWPNLMQDLANDRFDVVVGGITRTLTRVKVAEFLPPYAPFGKVALIRLEDKDRFTTVESLNQPDVHVIKNPGGTNEIYVDSHLQQAQVTMHPNNAEIPALIAEGKGDVMITETNEAIHYSRTDPRLYAAFLDHPLTPVNYNGFLLPKDDADYLRVMNFAWDLLDARGSLKQAGDQWLK